MAEVANMPAPMPAGPREMRVGDDGVDQPRETVAEGKASRSDPGVVLGGRGASAEAAAAGEPDDAPALEPRN